ncbi:hypothetical protein [Marinobacter salarius]
MISELELDRAFADKVVASPDFLRWVLKKTEFCELAENLILLNREQAEAKPNKKPENWWRHWWCRLDDGSESETDIFFVLTMANSQERIAVHIEDKPPHGKFTPRQYLNYRKRAKFMANKAQYMNYSRFTTVLLAPKSFIDGHEDEVKHFDSVLTYESVSMFIPLFAKSIQEAK